MKQPHFDICANEKNCKRGCFIQYQILFTTFFYNGNLNKSMLISGFKNLKKENWTTARD